jgi:hypothetical protein
MENHDRMDLLGAMVGLDAMLLDIEDEPESDEKAFRCALLTNEISNLKQSIKSEVV